MVAKTYTALATLTVKKGASTASLSFARYEDGSMTFDDENGNEVRVQASNQDARKIWDAINALV